MDQRTKRRLTKIEHEIKSIYTVIPKDMDEAKLIKKMDSLLQKREQELLGRQAEVHPA